MPSDPFEPSIIPTLLSSLQLPSALRPSHNTLLTPNLPLGIYPLFHYLIHQAEIPISTPPLRMDLFSITVTLYFPDRVISMFPRRTAFQQPNNHPNISSPVFSAVHPHIPTSSLTVRLRSPLPPFWIPNFPNSSSPSLSEHAVHLHQFLRPKFDSTSAFTRSSSRSL
ncbi:hypothetical protein EX30DRAFT_204993 [Ascodesmis nigricans]|uniref:Uncharacterized protein n=1 Tax=Ascodesmis nigricans TaxID=341454 RepID=A0A4S2MK04_9PEZI|nr:hypothetical protein EX30DRAFT_204993 [Ascodesmis nigricans]